MPRRDAKGRLSGGNPGNSGGKKGRSGRRPGWFKEFAGEVLGDPAVQTAIRKRAKDAEASGFWDGIKTLGAAAGEVVQVQQVKLDATVTFKAVRE